MTISLNITAAKARLSELIARAEAGEQVMITRAGKPAVCLERYSPPKAGHRQPGVWAKYGPPGSADLFLQADPELEALMDAPIEPRDRG